MNSTLKNDRIEVVDALRGVALFAIVILHCFEHYNLYYMPDCQPHWLTALDKGVWDTVWFLFGLVWRKSLFHFFSSFWT